MTQKQSLKLFEERNIRTIWDDTQEKWYFSVVDVIQDEPKTTTKLRVSIGIN